MQNSLFLAKPHSNERMFVVIPLLISPFLIPFLLFPIDVTYLVEITAALLTLVLWCYNTRRICIPSIPLLLLSILILGQLLIYSFGDIVNLDTWGIGILLVLIGYAYFIISGSAKKDQIEKFSNFYIFAVLLWSAAGLYCWLGGTGGHPLTLGPFALAVELGPKLSGPFAQGNIYAGMVAAAWLITLWKILFKDDDSPINYLLFAAFTVLSVCSLSKGAWITQFIMGICFFALSLRKTPAKLKQSSFYKLAKIAGLLLLSILFGYLLVELRAEVLNVTYALDSLDSLATNIDRSGNTRISIWMTSLIMFFENPFLGVGFGNYASHYFSTQPAALTTLYELGFPANGSWGGSSAHNIILQFLAEAGLAGGVAILAVCFLLLSGIRGYAHNPADPRFMAVSISALLLIQGMVNVTLIKPIPFIIFCIFMGFGTAPLLYRSRLRKIVLRGKTINLIVILLSLSFVGLLTTSYHSMTKWQRFENIFYSKSIYQPDTLHEIDALLLNSRVKSILAPLITKRVIMEGRHFQLLSAMKPHLLKSLHLLPQYEGFQLLFYIYMLEEDWEKACSTGRFIKSQHFRWDSNINAYDKTCSEKKPASFKFR